jgi:hypothetical protein
MLLEPHITDKTGDLDSELDSANQMSGNAWDQWLKTGDDKYIQQCLNKAADLSYIGVNGVVS